MTPEEIARINAIKKIDSISSFYDKREKEMIETASSGKELHEMWKKMIADAKVLFGE